MVKLNLPRELRTVKGVTYKILSYGLSMSSELAIEICTNTPRPNFDGVYADLDTILSEHHLSLSTLLYESVCINNLYTFLYSVRHLSTKED